MSSFQKVALVGKGNLGSAIVAQLVKAGFDVTVLGRSQQEASAGVSSVQVDYSSVESLQAAMRGHDAVISTVSGSGIPLQKTFIDAAIAAGVKRFIPSDFGSISTDPSAKDLPAFAALVDIQDYLKQKAQAGDIEYTILATGPFLEYTFGGPLFIDFPNRAVQFIGDGTVGASTTSLAGIGKAVAGALKKPSETKDRLLHVHEALVTQTKMLELAMKLTPEGAEWTVTRVDPEKALETATAAFVENPTDMYAFIGFFKTSMLCGKYQSGYTELDNELVGLDVLSDEDLEKDWAPRLAN